MLAATFLGPPATSAYPAFAADSYAQRQADLQLLQPTAQAQGTLRVLVSLQVPVEPEGRLRSLAQATEQRQRIADAQQTLSRQLTTSHTRVVRRFKFVPVMALEVDEAGLAELAANPIVAHIQEDEAVPPILAQSIPLIRANQAWALGFEGAGQIIAILDTGVDSAHEFLAGKVVGEACFSSTDAGYGSTTLCPNGQQSQVGPGAGVNCDPLVMLGCDHGTHVAGIAAGSVAGLNGVARGATILAVQVFSRFEPLDCGTPDPCVLSFTSDQISALEWVYEQSASLTIASVNMSLGSGGSTTPCDTHPLKFPIDQLLSIGVATVIASGNDGFVDAISAPGCISTAITVGSTDKSNDLSWFSNVAPFLDLLAPGESILSSVPGNDYLTFSGTSMAAPHVAGAWAVLKSKNPGASVDQVLAALVSSPVLVDDTRFGGIEQNMPRIDVLSAVNALQAPTPTPTATNTSSPTPGPTVTDTPTPTSSDTPLPTATDTLTPTPSNTPPPTATDTPSLTPSDTPLPTATDTPSPTPSDTPLPTATDTPSPTPSDTPTPTATDTSTPEPTGTPTPTDTPAPTHTPGPTSTETPGPSPTPSATSADTPTATDTSTPLPTATDTPSPTPSDTPLPTATDTPTPTPSDTPQPTATDTPTPTPSDTPTPTITPTPQPGDLNLDGAINVLDIQLCVNVFLGVETDPAIVDRADLNGDAAVNVLDVQLLVNLFLAG